VARSLDPRDLVTMEAGEIERRVREVGRRAIALHPFGDAPAPQQLHGARVERGRARVIDHAVALLDDEAAHAAPAEFACQRKADRPGSDNQYRRFRDSHDVRTAASGRSAIFFFEQIEAAQHFAIADNEDARVALGAVTNP